MVLPSHVVLLNKSIDLLLQNRTVLLLGHLPGKELQEGALLKCSNINYDYNFYSSCRTWINSGMLEIFLGAN